MTLQRGVLFQLASRLRARQGAAEGGGGAGGGVVVGEDGVAIPIDDSCTVSIIIFSQPIKRS